MTKTIFVLVHGTFAPNASWVKENSKLRGVLECKVEGEVDFRVFEWNGENTSDARQRAATRLAEFIKNLSNSISGQIIVVGHSHAGNITRAALNNCSETREKVSALITLNTPFIISHPRLLEPLVVPLLTLLLLIMVLPSAFMGVAILGYILEIFGMDITGNIWIIMVGFFAGPLIAWTTFKYIERNAYKILKVKERLDEKHDYATNYNIPMPFLVVRTSGDEAYLWLRLIDMVCAPLLYAVGLFSITFLFSMIGFVLLPLEYTTMIPREMLRTVFIFCGLGIVVELILSIVRYLLRGRLLGFNQLTYGEFFVETFLRNSYVSCKPPSGTSFEDLNYHQARHGFSLQHSSSYENPETLSDIAHWINNIVIKKVV